MIERRDLYLVIAATVLIINVIVGFHFYDVGRRKVALKATEDSLVVVRKEKLIIAKQRDSIGVELAKADVKSQSSRIEYIRVNKQTSIKGDSAYDSTGKFIQVLDKRISDRIKTADRHVADLEDELKVAKYAIKIDTIFIAKQEQETGLNKSIADLKTAPRGSWGLQVGIGGCTSAKGDTVPCGYIGLGYSVRF